MDNHIAEIEHEPAFAGLPLHATFLFVIRFGRFQHALRKRVKHAVAGSVADDKVIGKRCNILDVKKQDVFALFVLQGIDDFMGKF